jgi:hypothetical protein
MRAGGQPLAGSRREHSTQAKPHPAILLGALSVPVFPLRLPGDFFSRRGNSRERLAPGPRSTPGFTRGARVCDKSRRARVADEDRQARRRRGRRGRGDGREGSGRADHNVRSVRVRRARTCSRSRPQATPVARWCSRQRPLRTACLGQPWLAQSVVSPRTPIRLMVKGYIAWQAAYGSGATECADARDTTRVCGQSRRARRRCPPGQRRPTPSEGP